MSRQVVIKTNNYSYYENEVIRYGYTDFLNDGSYDSTNEQILYDGTDFNGGILYSVNNDTENLSVWNSVTEAFELKVKNTEIYEKGYLSTFIDGFTPWHVNDHAIALSPGECISWDYTKDIVSPSQIDVDIRANGIGGLEENISEIDSIKWLHIWVMQCITSNEVSAMATDKLSGPTDIPEHWQKIKRVATIRKDIDVTPYTIWNFAACGSKHKREYEWMKPHCELLALDTGRATNWTDVGCTLYCPTSACGIYLKILNASGSHYVEYRSKDMDNSRFVSGNDSLRDRICFGTEGVVEYRCTNKGAMAFIHVYGFIDRV